MSTSGSDAYTMSADAMSQAGTGAANAMAYQPMQVSAPTAKTSTVANTNMNQYMNPYTDQVVQTSQQALFDANQQALNANGYAATQAGAFGGSRHGVTEGQTNQAYLDANARMTADLYSQGYTQAQNIAAQDVAAKNNMAQYNATNGMNAQLANQNAGLQGAQLNLDASNSLANIGNTGFTQANTLANQQAYYGAQQQAANQALIDQSMGMWNGYAAQPGTSLGYTAGAVGSVPYGTSQTTSQTPGLFDFMTLPLAF